MSDPFGIYVHVPFCGTRCDYCAFVTYVGRDELHEAYVAALIAEYEFVRRGTEYPPATSVFFGGGTPSRIEAPLIGRVLRTLDLAPGAEVTLELNPEDATHAHLDGLVTAGVNRFSMGIQASSPKVLAELGRVHRGDEIPELLERLGRSGAERWSVDLILGARGEKDADVVAAVEAICDGPAAPGHVSAYLLTVEKGTPLSRDKARHPDDEVLATRYELIDELLSARGFEWYEISNWARPGQECRHNQLYWEQGDYLGLGVAAHSHSAGRRSWNISNLDTYLERLGSAQSPEAGEERVDGASLAFERLALALRTRQGVPLGAIQGADELPEFVDVVGDRLVLSRRGRLVADEMVRRLKTD